MTSASSIAKPAKSLVVGCGQTGRLADGAVDVGNDPAGPAHDVMVVVGDSRLVPGHGAGGLDSSHQADRRQRVEHVVHRLPGHLGQAGTDGAEDRLRVGVRIGVHRIHHRDARAGYA